MTPLLARRLAWVVTLTGVLGAPVALHGQHPPAPKPETKPVAASQAAKPEVPAKPAPKKASSSFSDLQAALARIQQRVSTSLGAAAAPQTAMTTIVPKKPVAPTAKPAETPAKPAETAAKPAEAVAKPAESNLAARDGRSPGTSVPGTSITGPTTPEAAQKNAGPRIELSWRTGLAWPQELMFPTDAAPAPPSSKRITLIWK